MKKALVAFGLLAVTVFGCASEEAWVKRRDAIRAHRADSAAQAQPPQTAPIENASQQVTPAANPG